ncbi:MAG TPA: hypothetical protein VHO25_07110 [Polyangiaceae bacterium]|nr:hypothetical protein [Polyangiaceae bacterium]
MVVSERSFWPASLSVAYVCAAAWQSSQNRVGAWGLLTLPLVIFAVWRLTLRQPDDKDAKALRACLRAATWGTLLWLAARIAPAGRPGFEAVANLGVAAASVACCIALARIPAAGGLLGPHPAARSLDAAVFCTVIWSIATTVPVARVLGAHVWLDPLTIDFTTTMAAVASLLVTIASAWRTRIVRRLELGVLDRASGALALATTAFAVAIPAAAANIAPPDRILPLAVLVASLAVIGVARAAQASSVARVLRTTVTVMMVGVPVALLGAALSNAMPKQAALVVLSSSLLCVGVGLFAHVISRPFGPERSRWLSAIAAASRGALEPEPDAALNATLRALESANQDASAHCEIWRRFPAHAFKVNIAGYLQNEASEAPERLYELAQREPLTTLRTEVLQALQVRRPEVRPLLTWMELRGALCVTLIVEEREAVGFLLIPKGRRQSTITIEEAEALQLLAGRVGALLAVSSALARSRLREQEARSRADQLQQSSDRASRNVETRDRSNRTFAEILARPVKTALYSAAARMASAQIERGSAARKTLVLEAPPGVDTVAWAAYAHTADPTRTGPLVVLDASAPVATDAKSTAESLSALLALPEPGTVLVASFDSLGVAERDVVERWLTSSARSEVSDRNALVLGVSARPSQQVDDWVMRGASRGWLQQVRLPALSDRPEDLQALILETLTRLGPGPDGEPLGLEPAALRTLLDHEWSGNETELKGALTRAAARCRGTRITSDDLAELTPKARSFEVPPPSTDLHFSSASRRRHSPRKH